MPELPEVEVTRQGLLLFCKNATVLSVSQADVRLRVPMPDDLREKLVGKRIVDVWRRAKYLVVVFEPSSEEHGEQLLVHLGMSGWFCAVPADTPHATHSHLILGLSNGYDLVYNDSRRFGIVDWCRSSPGSAPIKVTRELNCSEDYRLRELGVEPLGSLADNGSGAEAAPETAEFSGEYLLDKAAHRRGSVKTFLMNNAVVVGIGNIYAAEILHACRIHPGASTGTLDLPTWKLLASKTCELLKQSIQSKGTTFRDFLHTDGAVGTFAAQLRVYGRNGQPCFTCHTTLQKSVIAGRTTVFCPSCQADRHAF